jgi:hypothetical protein
MPLAAVLTYMNSDNTAVSYFVDIYQYNPPFYPKFSKTRIFCWVYYLHNFAPRESSDRGGFLGPRIDMGLVGKKFIPSNAESNPIPEYYSL